MSKKRRKPLRRDQPKPQGIDFAVASVFAGHALKDLQEILESLSEASRQAQVSIHVPGVEIDLPQSMLDRANINVSTIEQLYLDAIDRYRKLRTAARQNNHPGTKRLAQECHTFLSVIVCNSAPEMDEMIAGHSSNLLMIIDL